MIIEFAEYKKNKHSFKSASQLKKKFTKKVKFPT